MNEGDFRRAEEELRLIIARSPLEWILDDIEEAIAAGVSEEKILRRRPQRSRMRVGVGLEEEASLYETVFAAPRERSSPPKSGSLVVTTRPMTAAERLQTIYDALQRVLTELPRIEEETLRILRWPDENDEGAREYVSSIQFVPDAENRRRNEQAIDLVAQEPVDIERLSFLFDAMMSEADDESD